MAASYSQVPKDEVFEMTNFPEGVPPSGDPSDKLWLMYLSESEKHDRAISDGWKDDANGVLVFTGLFSATVAAFIIESYKQLSPDKTAFFLQQISQQLSGLSNGTYVRPQDYPTSSPSTSIVCVNAMWILSLIVSITCALLATLMQQWARQYVQLPQLRTTPRERAHVRSFLFFGLKQFRMSYAVELIPTLLHLAVFLFFVGLVIFFFTIFTTVAIIISASVGIFSIAYIALTILPCVYLNCPYRTPLSNLSWYVWHTAVRYLIALFLCIEATFHVQGYLIEWRNNFESYAQDHYLRRKDGLRKSVANRAQNAPEDRELQALNWFLHVPALSEDGTFQNFVSTLTEDTVQRLLQPSDSQFSPSFSHRLRSLLWTCLPGTTGLTADAQQHRLLTCLDVIYRGVKAYNIAPLDQSGEPIPDNIRVNFAELGMMRVLWSDQGSAVRVSARCICALLARRLLRDIGGPRSRRLQTDADIYWLTAVFDHPSSNEIYNSLHNLAEVDRMNLNSFVHEVRSLLLERRSTNREITSILDTLTILMDARNSPRRNTLREQIRELTQRAEISGCLQQLVTPLLELLREFPIDVGAVPAVSMPIPPPASVPQSNS
ncbi:hypothetical protein BJY52DRAFT_560492 [Lactarius psammicola]|nr:hypothetical protein BJY52DRAFT_560492 [Lactarius psammicola]